MKHLILTVYILQIAEMKQEEAALEKQLDEALEKGEKAEDNETAAEQNKIADSIEADLNDLKQEIQDVKKDAGLE